MHRVVIGAPPHLQVDHINRDPLDNRLCNLRLCTQSQNNANQTFRKNKTGFLGVYCNRGGRYRVGVKCDGKYLHLGTFDHLIEAARIRDGFVLARFGEFATLNFP
jgi:hypothetical protein